MSVNDRLFNWAKKISFETNSHLPIRYQKAIFEEALHSTPSVLGSPDLDKPKVLLVGGAGYVGSVLAGFLLKRGYSVRCLDYFLYENQQSITSYLGDSDFDIVYSDLCRRECFEKALQGVSDVVVLAGLVGDPITKKYPDLSQEINETGLQHFLEALRNFPINKAVFISTCSNYGLMQENQLANENSELRPLSLYAKAKVNLENQVLGFRGKVDFCPVILRFATAFGLSPRMRFDLTVNEFTREMYLGRELIVFDAHTWRPYCHVQDFSEVVARVLEAPASRVQFEVFNAGGDTNNYTKAMLVSEIRKYLPTAAVNYKEQGSDPRNYRVDFSKIRERLYFTPKFNVADGIRELIDALSNGIFADADSRRSFYGNYEIRYTRVKSEP